jgi:hypothetical protein
MTCKRYLTYVTLEYRLNRCLGAGKQGFQTPIATDSFIVDDIGALGNMQSERGLTYVEVTLAGHEYVIRPTM